jgi:tungstate transport system substrate-binding protein
MLERRRRMTSARFFALIVIVLTVFFAAGSRAAEEMTLATTTSTADSGLLDAILPAFEKANGVKVKVVAVGTGQALKLAQDGNADVVLVHARAKEDKFIAEGWGIDRRDVMYNDFVIVGPPQDPAGIKGKAVASEAFRAIAAKHADFASRGDESGTHTKEKDIWKKVGIRPEGEWYKSVGQGMGETLVFANEKKAYTLSDRATYLSMKSRLPHLAVLVGGEKITENKDTSLMNYYGVIAVNPAKHANAKYDLAKKFIQWITSAETQKTIGAFGVDKFGQSLFYPNAK